MFQGSSSGSSMAGLNGFDGGPVGLIATARRGGGSLVGVCGGLAESSPIGGRTGSAVRPASLGRGRSNGDRRYG